MTSLPPTLPVQVRICCYYYSEVPIPDAALLTEEQFLVRKMKAATKAHDRLLDLTGLTLTCIRCRLTIPTGVDAFDWGATSRKMENGDRPWQIFRHFQTDRDCETYCPWCYDSLLVASRRQTRRQEFRFRQLIVEAERAWSRDYGPYPKRCATYAKEIPASKRQKIAKNDSCDTEFYP